jgi:hypothetical protein
VITTPALARPAALVAMLIAAILAVSCGSTEVRTTQRTTPLTSSPSAHVATQATDGPTEGPTGPLAMGFTECPPPSQASAAGYAATDALHPAVVVMTWPETGWISHDAPDPISYGAGESLDIPETWLAADVARLQLIVCIERSTAPESKIQECLYVGGGSITRWRGDLIVRAYNARTGAKVEERVIEGQAPESCPGVWRYNPGLPSIVSWVGDPPPGAEVEDAIQHFVRTTPVPTAPVDSRFSDGTWRIGENLEPGTYRTVGYTDGCHWARLNSLS